MALNVSKTCFHVEISAPWKTVYELGNLPHTPIWTSRYKINSPGSNLTRLDGMQNLYKCIHFKLDVRKWLGITKKMTAHLRKNFTKSLYFFQKYVTDQSGRVC